jgi:alpha-L-rhamnosidase
MVKYILIILSLILPGINSLARTSTRPGELLCENLKNPLGIDQKNPLLSWTIVSEEKNQVQSAYELVVGDNQNDVKKGKGNVWTTGKINSADNVNITYGGSPLKSFSAYYWSVKIYNGNNEASEWSAPATFETAMLEATDWQSKWIGDGTKSPADADAYKEDRMPLLRREFTISKKVRSARLYISGLGYYEAYLNGKKIGDQVLDPGFTTYAKQVLYTIHDVTPLVGKGKNVTGIMLGSGWWNPLPFKFFGRWDLRDYQQTGRPCVKAELHIRYTDGSRERIVTDKNWDTAPGPIVRNNIYLGEHYDARLEQKNWNNGIVNDAIWISATQVAGPAGKLSVQMQPPIRVTKVVKPVNIRKVSADTFMVDMGRNFAGVARIKVKGPTGTKITLRYGEGLFKDGSLNVMTTAATQIKKGAISGGPGAPETAWQEDSYTLKGEGVEVWDPRFTFHGFQYVEVVGWPGTPGIEDIEGLRLNSDLAQDGAFSCSNQMFNKLHEAVQWTFLSNVFSVQSDCPGREKMGYGGDMVATSNAFIYNYNMLHFYNKAVRDFANEQRPLGGMTEIAPSTGIDDRGLGDLSGPLGWQLAFPFLQKQLYDFYGDKRIIETNYPAFKRQLAFLKSKSIDNTFYWDISDHEALDPKPEALTAAAFYYHHIILGAEFAGILGLKEDSTTYANLAKEVRNTIIAKFHVPGTGKFDNATESAQIFALWYGFSPEKENTLKALNDEFIRHHDHLSTGIFSTKMMFDVLRENDLNGTAYRIANQKTFPGWGYMLENGATTLWETWLFPEVDPSRNHPMFGSVDEWFYRSLAGINPLEPGFRKIQIKPQPAGDLTWVKCTYKSVRGPITSNWNLENNKFKMQVDIPANTTAVIYCPSKKDAAVTENGNPAKVTKYENGYAIIQVGSGSHSFESVK